MELTKTHKIIIGFIGGFLIGILLIWGWQNYSKRVTIEVPAETTAPTDMGIGEAPATITNEEAPMAPLSSDHIFVSAQDAGATVALRELTLAVPGWAVVHEENNGFIGNALGAARKDAGTHTDITISLLRTTEPQKRYWVVLYSDNGDRLFNLHDDFPLRDASDNPVMSSFTTN